MRILLHKRIQAVWYGNRPLGAALAPLGWMYRGLVALRRMAYAMGLMTTHHLSVPVIVVGSITAGGTGKTPLVIWLANFLEAQGYRAGIISRGYGGKSPQWPQHVGPHSDPLLVGDEAVVIARRCQCPVVVGPDRVTAAQDLVNVYACDVIVSDDGLQHLRLARDVEIAVIDGVRRHGNGRCLPAGPLREPVSSLRQVDLIVSNGNARDGEFPMRYQLQPPRPVGEHDTTRSLDSLHDTEVHAVAGIGDPGRFFASLRAVGIKVIEHAFPDHHRFTRGDLEFSDGLPVLLTEKDAVKCQSFAAPGYWYVPIEVELPIELGHRLLSRLGRKHDGQEAA